MKKIVFTYLAVWISGFVLLTLLIMPGELKAVSIPSIPVFIMLLPYLASTYLDRNSKLSTSRHYSVFFSYYILLFAFAITMYHVRAELLELTDLEDVNLFRIAINQYFYPFTILSLIGLQLYINIFIEPDDKDTRLSRGVLLLSIVSILIMVVESMAWIFDNIYLGY